MAMLLLGPAGVGKTTIIRQMSVSMGDGLSEELKQEAKLALWNCIIKKTLHLAEDAMSEEGPQMADDTLDAVDGLQDVTVKHLSGKDVDNVGQMVIKIWADAAIQASLQQIRSVTFEDDLVYQSAAMFQNEFGRIFTDGYLPTDDDMFKIRSPTTNITSTILRFKGEEFTLRDVGGQIQHQDMWMTAFKGCQAVLFIISLDDYHRNDGNGRNRLMESRELLLTICKSPDFLHLPLVLIFNKADLFNQRLNDKPLSTCSAFGSVPGKGEAEAVEDYKKRSLDTVTEYFVQGIKSVVKSEQNYSVGYYTTCATDSHLISSVMETVFTSMFTLVESKLNSFSL
jgi:GTPase SAR1 family protein